MSGFIRLILTGGILYMIYLDTRSWWLVIFLGLSAIANELQVILYKKSR